MSSHHGNTPAAWTGVAISSVGFVVAGVGLVLSPISMPIFWVGLALIVAGWPIWLIMDRMGLGA